nr:hypothetical protein [Tanacetum cinerariifolium]
MFGVAETAAVKRVFVCCGSAAEAKRGFRLDFCRQQGGILGCCRTAARGCRTAAKGVWFRLINKGCGCRTAARGCRTAAIRACLFRGTAATIRAAFGSQNS